MRRFPLALPAALAAVLGFEASPVAAQNLPTGFVFQQVVGEPFGSNPVAFAFLPDGRSVLLEKDTGVVRLSAVGSGTSTAIATIPNVVAGAERGLLGVAVDPSWPARPYLYFHACKTGDVIHIVMYTATGDLSAPSSVAMTLGSPFVLVDDIPDRFANHNGGTLRFGTDGHLYVSIGDDSRGCDAQDTGILSGKILRLDVSHMPGAGTGPPPRADITPAGNPFPGPDPDARLVWALGLRNPFRFTIDPQTNDLYVGDVGLETWEEMDAIPAAGGGTNYGWPEFEGPLQDPDPNFADCSTGPFATPLYYYPNPAGGQVAAVSGGPRYRPNPFSPLSFPSVYNGDLFFCEFYARWMRRLTFTGSGWSLAAPVPGQPSAENWAQNIGSVSDLQAGPDGALYLLVMFNSGPARGLHRIVNTLPSDADVGGPELAGARFVPNPGRVARGVTLHFAPTWATPIELRVYDVGGRLVRVLETGPRPNGSLFWDGRRRDGTAVGAGLYVYRLVTPSGASAEGRVLLF